MTLQEKIYEIIDKKGRKQYSVARDCGYTASYFNNMLRGRKIITAEDIPNICNALGVTANELFDGVDKVS